MFRMLVVTLMFVPGTPAAGAVSVCTARSGWPTCATAPSRSIRDAVEPVIPQPKAQTGRLSTMGFPLVFNAWVRSATEAVGEACRRTAKAPATCGADIDVPLSTLKVAGPGGTDEVMLEPGATRRFGKIPGEAKFEKSETASPFVDEATGMADEMHAGVLIASVNPELPAAMTVAIPGSVGSIGSAARSWSMASFCGDKKLSSHVAAKLLKPRLMLTAAIRPGNVWRWACTKLSASIWSDGKLLMHGAAPMKPPQSISLSNRE